MPRATAEAANPAALTSSLHSKRHRRAAAGVEFDTAFRCPGVQQRRVKSVCRAGFLGVAAQRQHEGMAVDDAGGRREQGGIAVQRRLQGPRGFAGEGLQIEHAIGLGMGPDRLQLQGFLRRGCNDEFAAIAMRNAVIGAVLVKRLLAADAHPRHQAAGRIVDAGVDDFAVARGGNRADPLRRLQNDDLAAGLGQPTGDGETDHAGTDNDTLNFVHLQSRSGLVDDRSDARGMAPGPVGDQPYSHSITLFGMMFSKNRLYSRGSPY